MAITTNTTVRIDGTSDFTIDGDNYSWSDDGYLGSFSIWSESAVKVNLNLWGSDWYIPSLRIGGQLKAVINDRGTGDSREIEAIIASSHGGNSVTLNVTETSFLRTGNGNDTIVIGGQSWVGTIRTEDGNDKVTINSAEEVESVLLGQGNNTLITGVNSGRVALVRALDGNDTVTLNGGSVEMISLGSGNNTVTVNAKVQEVNAIIAYGGNDTVTLNTPNWVDSINLGNGNNVVRQTNAEAGISSLVTYGGDDKIILTGEAESIGTGRGSDRVETGAWIGSLNTGRGTDTVVLGAGGADFINLGRDADTLIMLRQGEDSGRVLVNGGGGVSSDSDRDFDKLDLSRFSAAIVADLNSGYISSEQGNAFVREIEAVVTGSGHDLLIGNWDDNDLRAGAGRDTIMGGEGADTMFGGAGADMFVFNAVDGADDLILAFTRAQGDKIDLSELDADLTRDDDQDFTFIGRAAFSGSAGELRFSRAAGQTTIAGDLDGDGSADFSIILNKSMVLQASDFIGLI